MRKPTIYSPVIMDNHIEYKSGKSKTVCVTACLTALGIPFDSFQVTGTLATPNYLPLINKAEFCARSRKSKMPKSLTIGKCRKAIEKLKENAVYFVVLQGNGYCHAILINNEGQTIIDTDPRKRDKRKVYSIHAIFRG